MAAKKDEPEENQENTAATGEAAAAPDGAEAAPADDGKKSRKLPFIIVGIVALLLVVGAGLYFTGMLDGVLGKKTECAEGEEHCEEGDAKDGAEGHGDAAKHASTGVFLPIPTMIVNLSSEDGAPRYLRLTVQLELKNQEDLHAVEGVIPRVIDQFQTYLRELRVRDLRGSAGIYRLQMELLWRVNQAAAPVEVKDVLFQEILIQ